MKPRVSLFESQSYPPPILNKNVQTLEQNQTIFYRKQQEITALYSILQMLAECDSNKRQQRNFFNPILFASSMSDFGFVSVTDFELLFIFFILVFSNSNQCLQRERFVTWLCLKIWLGGMPPLLASPQVMSFWPSQPAP